MENTIFYYLTTEDIQKVAQDELGRELTIDEIEILKDDIPKWIDWYQAIASSMMSKSILT